MKARAKLLDDGLAKLQAYWAGEFEPRPVNGTIPIWVAARWPFKRGPLSAPRATTASSRSIRRARRRWAS